jgi:hypothetical protein
MWGILIPEIDRFSISGKKQHKNIKMGGEQEIVYSEI